jgi:diphthine synthase
MSLVLVGLGVGLDLTLQGLRKSKEADEIYLENYTNPFTQEEIEKLEKEIGNKIIIIGREQVEGNFLIEKAAKKRVALLVSGDPLIATTHITLIMSAKEKEIECKTVHNSSIFSAAKGVSGLQAYKFGRVVTLVNPRENYKPTSSIELIRENYKNNLHTLVLLDTEPKPMEAKAALEMLGEFERAIVISRIGRENEKISFGRIQNLGKKEMGDAPFAVIIPGEKMHFLEEEYFQKMEKE